MQLILENAAQKAMKKDARRKVQALHAQKRTTPMKDWHLLNDQIDETIVEWNRVHPKGANYLDLHWMTLHGAIRFVETEIRQRSSGVIKLETGFILML
ncbi:hypothetical protein CRE_02803 [Caenorhabditis remanei]|uniref:Smr domain-containing protein n=1 Tax=Caenorhabditis remanei TaxID=31234 RepID=E3LX16_CAERE|nr:hypothetical protein CRE_02803 [Caenorhabditis remanei]